MISLKKKKIKYFTLNDESLYHESTKKYSALNTFKMRMII